ncbi:hypothetical protein GEV33_010765 [Tenebrio molitor]|uniref:Immunoglobulin I-set domain-containing protein n=1 Tax=Tenebrio molitor TaxID=7067 RepID=A0A8J6HCQ8_TENMO|nr:hypothetical protein GEV33_010765 [Tenebrio molitor]
MDNGYKKYMMLKIRRVNKSDFGSYKCVAKNSLGETDGVIKLEGKTRAGDRFGRGGANNRVDSSSDFDDAGLPEYDYDGEYTLPSNGPPPIQEPPGAFSGAASSEKFNWCIGIVFAMTWIFSTSLR